MPGFPVRGLSLGGAISLDQNKARRVILLLGEIKPDDARLLEALSCVGEGGLFESLDVLRLHMNVDVND